MRRSGFTLIELLVVIAIIGVLTALVIISLQGSQKKAGDADRKTKAKSLATAVEQYFVDYAKYPHQDGVTTGSAGLEIQTAQQTCAPLLATALVTTPGNKRYLEGSEACIDEDPLIAHQYKSADGTLGKYYLIAWQLKYQNEDPKGIDDHGNGVYEAVPGGMNCSSGIDGPPVGSGHITGHTIPTEGTRITINCIPPSNYFVVYGPQ